MRYIHCSYTRFTHHTHTSILYKYINMYQLYQIATIYLHVEAVLCLGGSLGVELDGGVAVLEIGSANLNKKQHWCHPKSDKIQTGKVFP